MDGCTANVSGCTPNFPCLADAVVLALRDAQDAGGRRLLFRIVYRECDTF